MSFRPARRPTTYELYEITTRLYLKPALGAYSLRQLTVGTLQTYLNRELAAGRSVRQVQLIRAVLGAALSRAHREELVVRNVARLVELPKWERGEIQPWTEAEASRFLGASRSFTRYHPAFRADCVLRTAPRRTLGFALAGHRFRFAGYCGATAARLCGRRHAARSAEDTSR